MYGDNTADTQLSQGHPKISALEGTSTSGKMIAQKSFSNTLLPLGRKMHENRVTRCCNVCFGVRQPAPLSNERQDHYNGEPKQLES
jgi:hypothetical protein